MSDTPSDEEVLPTTFEERADQIEDAVLLHGTVVEDHFELVRKALIGRGLVLI